MFFFSYLYFFLTRSCAIWAIWFVLATFISPSPSAMQYELHDFLCVFIFCPHPQLCDMTYKIFFSVLIFRPHPHPCVSRKTLKLSWTMRLGSSLNLLYRFPYVCLIISCWLVWKLFNFCFFVASVPYRVKSRFLWWYGKY